MPRDIQRELNQKFTSASVLQDVQVHFMLLILINPAEIGYLNILQIEAQFYDWSQASHYHLFYE